MIPVNITDMDATITDAENAELANVKLVVSADPDGAAEQLSMIPDDKLKKVVEKLKIK